MMKNASVQSAVKIATVAGSAILVVNSVMKLTKVSDVKGALMPVVSILVGAAAFKYATAKGPVLKA
tara:strand:+ start:336 stop:533 length:198 start_codon:yes stop_codon:yes gene_type:complete